MYHDWQRNFAGHRIGELPYSGEIMERIQNKTHKNVKDLNESRFNRTYEQCCFEVKKNVLDRNTFISCLKPAAQIDANVVQSAAHNSTKKSHILYSVLVCGDKRWT